MSGVKPNGLAAWSRPLLAELMGTALLVTVVVGSGIAAARLSPADGGLQLLGKQHGDGVRAGGVDLGVWAGLRRPLQSHDLGG